jgi:hypothetical protein
LGITFKGKNGTQKFLSPGQGMAFEAVLSELLGRTVSLEVSPESECKIWASTLRNNLTRIRLLKDDSEETGYEALVIEGSNLEHVASTHYYSTNLNLAVSQKTARPKPLDEEWKYVISDFAEFLDTCGGIVEVG